LKASADPGLSFCRQLRQIELAQSGLRPLSDQQPTALVLVQVELLDGRGLSALAIGRFDRAEIFAFAADDDDAPAS
jgi:hypothetical protein